MIFSVLLPTRNGLQYLKYAIASVLGQNYENWEVIVSDNASEEDIAGYIRSLNESRIKYTRSEEFLSVTENWNRCLEQSQGDYLIMLGDDDIILKNYFQIMSRLLSSYHRPALIYADAFLYAYPKVLPHAPNGLFQPFGSLNRMPQKEVPFFLDLNIRYRLVKLLLKFQMSFGTHMPHALISRDLVEKVKKKGKFFHSPYPDFYAMCALFLEAEQILIYPKELVVIGISTKSHGYYFFNQKEEEGVDFLNIHHELAEVKTIRSILLPGSGVATFWLAAMETLKNHFSLEKYGLKLEYQKYRQEQIRHVLRNFLHKKGKYTTECYQLLKQLSRKEKIGFFYPVLLWFTLKQKVPKTIKHQYRRLCSSSKKTVPSTKTFANAAEIYEQILPIDCFSSILN